jgi:hypothetical protein
LEPTSFEPSPVLTQLNNFLQSYKLGIYFICVSISEHIIYIRLHDHPSTWFSLNHSQSVVGSDNMVGYEAVVGFL